MADGIEIKFEGVEKTIQNLKRYQTLKIDATKTVLKEVGFNVQGDAKKGCPVDTGRLKASLSTNWSGSPLIYGATGGQAEIADGVGRPTGAAGLLVVTGTNVKYAPYVEYGTMRALKSGGYRSMASRLYLSKAYHKNLPELEMRIRKIFKK